MISFKTRILSKAANAYIKCKKYNKFGEMPDGFTFTCHAGAMLTKANSLESVREAIEWGAQIVEFDVSFRPSGTAVIIHNGNPTEKMGVLLEDALKIVADSETCKINLDLKSTANVAEVDRLVNKYNLSARVFYTGVFADWVDAVKSSSDIPYYLNHSITKEEASDKNAALAVVKKAKELGAFGINSNFRGASKLFVDTMHENGLLVSLWTANNADDMVKCIELKPDNITTKKPNMLKALLK